MEDSIERINPDDIKQQGATSVDTLQLHLERYQFAGKNLVKGLVADIACGVGYGSDFLMRNFPDTITGIVAVDIHEESISYARSRYAHPNIRFIAANAMEFKSSVALQNIVSLETLEHLPDPQNFVKHIGAQLETGGRFIASVPITPSMDANPFHLQDFTAKSFRRMFADAGFKEITSITQVQSYNIVNVLLKKEKRTTDLRGGMLSYYMKNPGKFFLRLRSLLTDGFTNKYLVSVFEKL